MARQPRTAEKTRRTPLTANMMISPVQPVKPIKSVVQRASAEQSKTCKKGGVSPKGWIPQTGHKCLYHTLGFLRVFGAQCVSLPCFTCITAGISGSKR